ncbi:hypothetical protein BH23BAC1_BH23BAC1_37000 [soil metagenome]
MNFILNLSPLQPVVASPTATLRNERMLGEKLWEGGANGR